MNRIAKEISIYILCVVVALLVNIYAIVAFHTRWTEIFTTLPITLALALVFYVVLAIPRGIVFFLSKWLTRKPA